MILVEGREIATDNEGYLANLEDWSEAVANYLAEKDNLPLENRPTMRWCRVP